ncbi:specifically androgen-regulated gene protein [Colossoma macropomum]|uniref:specifically androgen-regulated gene protein n=1 Tax=Colossoma macropomum TaxID=42526 RepID=UPI0018650C8D|nr:specifically androgen-regulated gene protein [Colossoma macropomum]
MPKSDMWPGGVATETVGEMDSADSCDSVVSINSCFSDDSLQYLSAEEKACLMFLEETIESLDTEDDSGLSNDEAESLPVPGNVAIKTAHLSASMDQSKHKDVPKHYIDDPRMFGSSEHNQILNYLVPTPFVLANNNAHIPPKPADSKEKLPSKEVTSHKSDKDGPRVPSEVNVVVIPPPVIVKSSNERDRGLQNDQSPRGPLTYEGLVQLRKKVALRKNPEDEKQPHTHSNDGRKVFSQNIQPIENQGSKNSPPAVAPKPKKIPSHITVLNHKGTTAPNADSTIHCLSTSPGSKGLMKPEQVRLEALSKLGLLKESDSKPSTKGHPSESLQPSSGSVPDLSQSRPLPPCASVRNQESRNQPSQGSSVLHHRSMTDLATVPPQLHHVKPAGGKSATLERSGTGWGSSMSNSEISDCQSSAASQNHLQRSSTVVSSSNLGNIQRGRNTVSTGKPQAASGQSSTVPHKPLHAPGLNVLVVPNMGEDRREALRKLGLLKN